MAFLLAALVLCSVVQAQATQADDRAVIIAGVNRLVAPGCIPGDIAVFGERGVVVWSARSGGARLPVIGAIRHGSGRAAAIGHEGFFGAALAHPDNAALARNLASWAGGGRAGALRIGLVGQDRRLREVLAAAGHSVRDLRAAEVRSTLAALDVLWLGQASLDGPMHRAAIEPVRGWVRRGGGLVVGGPAWGWKQLNPERRLESDHSGNALLIPMGLAFGDGLLDGDADGAYAREPEPPALASARVALEALDAHAAGRRTLDGPSLRQAAAAVGQAANLLPDDEGDFMRRVATLCRQHAAEVAPTREKPIRAEMPFARLRAALDLRRFRGLRPDQVRAHPAAESFPGPVPADASPIEQQQLLNCAEPGWHSFGLYAPPGRMVTITLPPEADGLRLAARIGPHTDTLWHLERWERFPEVSFAWPLRAGTNRIASPFGGTLFLVVPEDAPSAKLPVAISGAVAAPRYVRGETRLNEWRATLRHAPGPWAELEGRRVILSVPSSVVRTLDDPETLMAYWDEVLDHCYALYAEPVRARRERYCVDRQISAGYMHAGYPIMTHDDVAALFVDVQRLRAPNAPIWGFYHELGHNFQRPEWTWDAWGEVTNNLFSLYGAEKINGTPIGAHPAITDAEIAERIRVVAAKPSAERYYARDPWYPLTMLVLLQREFGWESFTRLFAEFAALPPGERPGSEQAKRDQFLTRLSRITGRNLSRYLATWGVQTTETARAAIRDLPEWMPASWPRG